MAGFVRRFRLVERHMVIEQHHGDEWQFVLQQFDGLCKRGLDIDGLEPEFGFDLGVTGEFVFDAIERYDSLGKHDDHHGVFGIDVVHRYFECVQQRQLQLLVQFHRLVDHDDGHDDVEQLGVVHAGLQRRLDHGHHDLQR